MIGSIGAGDVPDSQGVQTPDPLDETQHRLEKPKVAQKVDKCLHPCGGAVMDQLTKRGKPMKAYYTLCVFDAEYSRWSDYFGDYSRDAVEAELESFIDGCAPAKHLKIITTNGTFDDLIAKRDALPAPKAKTPKAKAAAATVADLIAGVRNHARVNYGKGGWDILYECWDDQDIGAQITEGDTLPRAIARIKRVLNDVHNHREEIQSTAW
jgi:hypothetical protein